MRLILVRHGETLWNRERRIQGCRSDTELSITGKEQAEKVSLLMKNQKVTAVYSSSLKRAMETANIIALECGLKVKDIPELKEIDAGDLEGLLEEKLKGQYREFWDEWRRGNPSLHLRLPGGESLEELQRRVWPAVERITEKHHDGVIAVISHFFVNLTIICQALGLDLRYMGRMRQDPASISVLELTKQRNSLSLLNDTCHLAF